MLLTESENYLSKMVNEFNAVYEEKKLKVNAGESKRTGFE